MAELRYRRHQATATTALQMGSDCHIRQLVGRCDSSVVEEQCECYTGTGFPRGVACRRHRCGGAGCGHCSTRMVNLFTVTVRAGRPDTRSGVSSELKHLCYVSKAVTDHTLTPYTIALMPRSTTFGSCHHRQPAWPVC